MSITLEVQGHDIELKDNIVHRRVVYVYNERSDSPDSRHTVAYM